MRNRANVFHGCGRGICCTFRVLYLQEMNYHIHLFYFKLFRLQSQFHIFFKRDNILIRYSLLEDRFSYKGKRLKNVNPTKYLSATFGYLYILRMYLSLPSIKSHCDTLQLLAYMYILARNWNQCSVVHLQSWYLWRQMLWGYMNTPILRRPCDFRCLNSVCNLYYLTWIWWSWVRIPDDYVHWCVSTIPCLIDFTGVVNV